MGRIKTKLIKRTVNKLIKDYEPRFSDNFDNNKKAVLEVLEVESKKLRNIVAGYVTRIMKEDNG